MQSATGWRQALRRPHERPGAQLHDVPRPEMDGHRASPARKDTRGEPFGAGYTKNSCVNQPFQRGATLERRMRNGPASSLARAVSPPSSWRRRPVRRAPSVSTQILAEILMVTKVRGYSMNPIARAGLWRLRDRSPALARYGLIPQIGAFQARWALPLQASNSS